MKFFRQRSSASTSSEHQKRLSFSAGVNGISHSKVAIDSIDDIVKRLRQALNKSAANLPDNNDSHYHNSGGSGAGAGGAGAGCVGTGHTNQMQTNNSQAIAAQHQTCVTNDNTIRQCLEELRHNITVIYLHTIAANNSHNNNNSNNDDQNITQNHKNRIASNSSECKENSSPQTATTSSASNTPTKANSNNNANNNTMKLIDTYTEELYSTDIIHELIQRLPQIGFENRKLIASIVCNALLLERDGKHLTVEYICREPTILVALLDTYRRGRSDLTLFSGRLLRQCLHHQSLAAIVLNGSHFDGLFAYVNQRTFDVAMDAFITFRTVLTTHPALTEQYIVANRIHFFHNYLQLITADNYVTQRQSLEILALILAQSVTTCRQFCVHSAYMSAVLKLFWHKYRHIRFHALNVFNVLINIDSQLAAGVMDFLLLQANRHSLLEALNGFRTCRTKCKLFSALKPFAAKLIQFFAETTAANETQDKRQMD